LIIIPGTQPAMGLGGRSHGHDLVSGFGEQAPKRSQKHTVVVNNQYHCHTAKIGKFRDSGLTDYSVDVGLDGVVAREIPKGY